jgi:hypothetical protein
MPVTIKKAVLWRKQLDNRPGTLAESLKPLAEAGISLQVVMGYAFPGDHEHAAVEVWPIDGEAAETAAAQAGLNPSPQIACLIVVGDDVAGLGHAIADRLASNGINISFVMVQVSNDEYHGVFGFESQQDADKAAEIIEAVGKTMVPERPIKAKRAAAKRTAKSASGKGKTKARAKSAAGKRGARKATAGSGSKKAAKKKAGRKAGAGKAASGKGSSKKARKR